jgi:hypothetical protein
LISSGESALEATREPPHIHVVKDGIDARFWLLPKVLVDYHDAFDARTLRNLTEIVAHRREFILRKWNDFFGEG